MLNSPISLSTTVNMASLIDASIRVMSPHHTPPRAAPPIRIIPPHHPPPRPANTRNRRAPPSRPPAHRYHSAHAHDLLRLRQRHRRLRPPLGHPPGPSALRPD